uniref:Ankyrin repeat protein n=1 Tax=viral metagenome TaxID=1070528 RepID=A0A6C0E6X8_9ZZZZ
MYVKISTVNGILICKNIKNLKLDEYLCERYSIKNIYINILIEKKLMYYNFADVISPETYSYIEDNNVIISDSYNIFDIETILNFKLDVTKQYIGALCRANRNDTLQHLYKHTNYKNKIIKMLEDDCIDCISRNYHYPYIFYTGLCNGSSLILEWGEENNTMPIKYFNTSNYSRILDLGSSHGVIHILDWFIKSGLKYGFELKYSDNALNSASGSGYTNVLDWWFNSELELKYYEKALDWASKNNHINVLN